MEAVHRWEQRKISHQDVLSLLGIGAENEDRPSQAKEVCYRAHNVTGEMICRRTETEDQKLAYLLCCLMCFSGGVFYIIL